MKQLFVIGLIIFITSSMTCRGTERGSLSKEGENKIMIDLISCISAGTVRFGFGHSLGGRWSVEGKMGIRLSSFDKTDTETLTHWKDTGRDYLKIPEASFRECLLRMGMNIQYWPYNTYKGVFISLGTEFYDRRHPDCIIGLGYVLRIWKNLHADLSFKTGIIEAARTQKILPEGLEVCISYIF